MTRTSNSELTPYYITAGVCWSLINILSLINVPKDNICWMLRAFIHIHHISKFLARGYLSFKSSGTSILWKCVETVPRVTTPVKQCFSVIHTGKTVNLIKSELLFTKLPKCNLSKTLSYLEKLWLQQRFDFHRYM